MPPPTTLPPPATFFPLSLPLTFHQGTTSSSVPGQGTEQTLALSHHAAVVAIAVALAPTPVTSERGSVVGSGMHWHWAGRQ